MTSARRSAAALLLAALAAPLASAQETRMVGEVEVTVTSPWPAEVHRGYFPVFVDLRGEPARARDVSLVVEPVYAHGTPELVSSTTVAVEAGERRSVELLVPGTSQGGNTQLQLVARSGRESARFDVEAASEGWPGRSSVVAVVAPSRLPAGDLEALRQRTEEGLESKLQSATAGSVTIRIGRRAVRSAGADVGAFELDVDELPSRAAAWTSVDLVVVHARDALPVDRSARWGPLLAWVRQGGQLVVVGPEARAEFARVPGAESLFEQRFATEVELDPPRAGVAAWSVGLGRLVVDESELDAAEHGAVLARLVAASHATPQRVGPLVPGGAGRQGQVGFLQIPGIGELPIRVFLLLLIVFAAVIGPVNFILLRRMTRPALLLVSIPTISLVASVGILAYGVLHQGIDVKAARHSVTVLDQRSARADTVERRALFAGLTPRGGLRPALGTSAHAVPVDYGELGRLEVEHGSELRLSGDFLPVRTLVNHIVLRDSAARERLLVERTDAGIAVTNGFSARVEALELRDAAGVEWRADAELAPGARAELRRAEETGSLLSELSAREPYVARVPSAPATYVARLDANPFTDDCGLDLNVKSELHVVAGVLPADEADWGN